jgi:5'-nucleotidase
VRTIVALIHEGGVPVADGQCVSGPIRDIVERTSPEVDVFMTGHTHQIYNCVLDGRPVTSAGSFGRLVTDVTVTIDRRSGQTRRVTADNLVVTRDVAQDPAQTALIARYKAIAGPIGDRVIGQAAADITRAATPAGESALGDVIADSRLEPRAARPWAARRSLMNRAASAPTSRRARSRSPRRSPCSRSATTS